MSSHADQKQLIDWVSSIKHVKKVFLTHGDNLPREELAKKITTEVGISDVVLPNLKEEIHF